MFSYQPEMQRYVIVDTVLKLKRLVKKMRNIDEFAYDTETNTLKVLGDNKDFSLVGISISWGEYDNYYIPVGHRRHEDYYGQIDLETVVKYIKPIFEREDVRIIGWNLKFDLHVLARIGISVKTSDLFDGMIASWLCDENTPNGLKDNSIHFLGIKQTKFAEVIDNVPNEVKKEFGLKATNKATFDLVLIDDAAPYALMDSFHTWELYLGFMFLLEDEGMSKIYDRVYRPFISVLFNMEESGVTVDIDRLSKMSDQIKEDMKNLEYQMFELAGVEFNPSSGQQLAELLFNYRKPDKKDKNGKLKKANVNENILAVSFDFRVISLTDGGAPQTNGDTLWRLSRMSFKNKRKKEGTKLCGLLCEYKKLDKLCSAFIDGLFVKMYDDGKVHPSFNIIGTDSGRLSCSEPNLQQLPRANEADKYQIRSLFIGSEYLFDFNSGEYICDYFDGVITNDNYEIGRKKIIALDFSNLEMRVLAHFSEDENLLNMFAEGLDTHGSTAVNMFELDCGAAEAKKLYPHLRQAAKTINFMLMYGGGAFALYNKLRDDRDAPIDLADKQYTSIYGVNKGEEVAQIYIDKYFATYSGVAKFIKNQKRFAHRNECVYTLLQRKRRLPDINKHDHATVGYCERLSVNAPIQGSAADITMSAQLRIAKDPWYEAHGAKMLLQVHDELVFECPEKYIDECISRTKQYMEKCFGDKRSLNLPLLVEADFGDNYAEAK